jgi:hypothetical protein
MRPLIRARTCRACAHSQIEGAQRTCHAHPPSAHPILMPTPQGPRPVGTTSAFPIVQDNEWCGEWRARIETAAGTGRESI